MGVTFLKRILSLAAALVLACAIAMPAHAQQPAVGASCAVLMDAGSGRMLYAKAPHQHRLIASITKLMTALVAAERIPDVDREVEIRAEWLGSEGSSIYLTAGEHITVRGLLYGLLLQSGNDAAMALACHTAGDMGTFVGWMNARAAELGMENTHFANPSGLNAEDHYSSAYDMALLARACLENELVAEICAARSAAVGTRTFYNHNKLLTRYPGCIGMKTGYTEKAGRTLVSAARREGQTLICVTLNDPNDWDDHTRLLDFGFSAYPARALCEAGESFGSVPISGSLVPSTAVLAKETVSYPLGAEETVTMETELPPALTAPVSAGQPVGRVVWYLNRSPIAETELVCAASVAADRSEKIPLWQRLLDWFRTKAAG